MFSTLCVTLLLSLIGKETVTTVESQTKTPDSQMLHFHLREKNLRSKSVSFRNLTLDSSMLAILRLTKDEIEAAWIEVNGTVEELVTSKGRRIEMETKLAIEHQIIKKTLELDISAIENMTFDDLKDDPRMVPEEQPHLDWESHNRCSFFSLKLALSLSSVEANINYKKILEYNTEKVGPNGDTTELGEEGLLLTVVNLQTCKATFHDLFYTTKFGGFRQLNWVLDSILPGSLVILTSLSDGSLLFNETSREKLSNFGSYWSNSYSYKDTWANVFIKGGPTLAEVILPNLGSSKTSGSPLYFHVSLPGRCKSWPDTKEWRARKIFCENYDGYRSLCNCELPLEIPAVDSEKEFDPEMDIPICIPTSLNRSQNVLRLLETLLESKGIKRHLIVISIDEYDEKIAMIAFILGIKCLMHRTEGMPTSRISQAAKFVLFNQLLLFQKAKSFIFLDDDIIVSKDFYQFMQQVSPIFEMDKTIWCASGFSFFSYPHTSFDPTRLYRAHHRPIWGWMMPRYVLEEILPKWVPHELDVDYDLYLALERINKGRICVVPEVLRSVHGPSDGVHVHISLGTEKNLHQRVLNQRGNVKLQPLERVKKDYYDKEIERLAKMATPVTIISAENFTLPFSETCIYAVYLNKASKYSTDTSMIVHKIFGVWSGKTFMDVNQFPYFDSTVLIIGHPSPYSLFIPYNYSFYEPSPDEIDTYLDKEDGIITRKKIEKKKHRLIGFAATDLEETLAL